MKSGFTTRVLVTGAEGFVARHLLPALRDEGSEVIGTVLHSESTPEHSGRVLPLDLRDCAAVRTLIQEVHPTFIVHLAAVSSVRESFEKPQETIAVNVAGTEAILDAAAALPRPARVLLVGSGDEYGPNHGAPLPELPLHDLHPVSPYGESKKAVEALVERTAAFRQITIRTRSFPHIGPGQGRSFFIPDVVTQIVRAERGRQPPVIRVGNLAAVRDFTDVRDVTRAYALLLKRGTWGGVYNVCSGAGVTIAALLHEILKLSTVAIHVTEDPQKFRPVDIPVLIGDPAKLRRDTGWLLRIPRRVTLGDIIADARQSD